MDWISEQLGIEKTEDWHQVTASQLKERGATSLLHSCGDSVMLALQSVYPEYEWIAPNANYDWKDSTARRNFMDWVAAQLNIEKQSDWTTVSAHRILKLKGTALLRLYGFSVFSVLRDVYPEFDWKVPKEEKTRT